MSIARRNWQVDGWLWMWRLLWSNWTSSLGDARYVKVNVLYCIFKTIFASFLGLDLLTRLGRFVCFSVFLRDVTADWSLIGKKLSAPPFLWAPSRQKSLEERPWKLFFSELVNDLNCSPRKIYLKKCFFRKLLFQTYFENLSYTTLVKKVAHYSCTFYFILVVH